MTKAAVWKGSAWKTENDAGLNSIEYIPKSIFGWPWPFWLWFRYWFLLFRRYISALTHRRRVVCFNEIAVIHTPFGRRQGETEEEGARKWKNNERKRKISINYRMDFLFDSLVAQDILTFYPFWNTMLPMSRCFRGRRRGGEGWGRGRSCPRFHT